MATTHAEFSAEQRVTIGIVTALEKEYAAIKAMLDAPRDHVAPDGRVYLLGEVRAKGGGEHHVAVVLGDQGTTSAAVHAAALQKDFPRLSTFLMVGIAGAVPQPAKPQRHVRLGDVVVSGEGGIVAYDFVKEHADRLEPRHPPRPPDWQLLQSARRLASAELDGERTWLRHIDRGKRLSGVVRPDVAQDRLASTTEAGAWLVHPEDSARRPGEPRVFLGTIACANRLLKNPVHRDQIRDDFDVHCVEMEGFGVAEVGWQHSLGYLVVRGTCDYCDGNKGDDWQGYAALIAAAYARGVLEETPTLVPRGQRSIELRSAEPTSREDLVAISRALLEIGKPPSVSALFPDAPMAAHHALERLERSGRVLTNADAAMGHQSVASLVRLQAPRHLVVGAPGSGKTFALWHGAHELLAGGVVVPLYVALGSMDSWDDVSSLLTRVAGQITQSSLLSDTRVCLFLDGWLDFVAAHPRDAAAAMGVLHRTRVIATGRSGSAPDPRFQTWDISPLAISAVRSTLRAAVARPAQSPRVEELLRLPLALALHIYLDSSARTAGELLERLDATLSQHLPEGFRNIVAGSVAALDLAGAGRTRARFELEVQERATRAGISAPLALVDRLGTLTGRGSIVVPLHDLYWSWLSGYGILAEGRVQNSLLRLSSREGLSLALDGGARPPPSSLAVVSIDAILAARLSTGLDPDIPPVADIATRIRTMLADERLPVRGRGALAALYSRRGDLLPFALRVVSELVTAGTGWRAIRDALDVDVLVAYQGAISEWLGSAGSELMIETIARQGDERWVRWIEQMVHDGRISVARGVGATLACSGTLSTWSRDNLLAALETKTSHVLSWAAMRGANADLARWIAEHYEAHVGDGDSRFMHLNEVLVGCGDESVWQRLLARFPTMPTVGQRLLGYAVAERGEPWLARFQEAALANDDGVDHHRLLETMSASIDETVARAWTRDHRAVHGWRALVARLGSAVVPDLIAALPASFDGLHDIAALSAMERLNDVPTHVVDEIWSRVRGTMTPRGMEQVIRALASCGGRGFASLVATLNRQPDFLPSYHAMRFVELLQRWEEGSGIRFNVKQPSGEFGFIELVIAKYLRQEPDGHFTHSMLKTNRTRMVPFLLARFDEGDVDTVAHIEKAGTVHRFHAGLVQHLLHQDGGGTRIAKLFASTLDTFPESVLLQVLASQLGPPIELARALAQRPSPAHGRLHVALIQRLFEHAFDLRWLEPLAMMMAVHPPAVLPDLLQQAAGSSPHRLWLIRAVENAAGRLLVDEQGEWLRESREVHC